MTDPKDTPPPKFRELAWWELAFMILWIGGGIAYGFALVLNGTPGG